MQRDLVERAMTGDHDAFAELARVSIGRLFVVARLILRDEAAAEDATQEALVAVWRHIHGLRDPDRFEAWLHRLLVNACNREARSGRKRSAIELHVAANEAPQPDPNLGLLDRDQLERGFLRLEADQRAVLVLHYYVGLSLDDVAEALSIPRGTVRSRLHRATQAMRAALDADARPRTAEAGRSA
jgi:RNA polymerase sigma-70 factor (ECF subfamily)